MVPYVIIWVHFVSDWILQPRKAAERKTSNPYWMVLHVGTIFVCFFIAGLAVMDWPISSLLFRCLLNSIAHFFIDATLWGYFKVYTLRKAENDMEYIAKNKWVKDSAFYHTVSLDQIMHLFVAFLLFT